MKIKTIIFPILLASIISLTFFYPAIFQNKILLPVDLLVKNHSFWSEKYHIPVKNPMLQDSIIELYPNKYRAITQFKRHISPLWNTHQEGGAPMLANIQTAVLYPFNILFLSNNITGWNLYIITQVFFSIIFSILLARELKISKLGSLISSISFTFSGFMMHYLINANIVHTIMWMPLLTYLNLKYIKYKSKWFYLSPIILTLSFLAGHTQLFIYTAIIYITTYFFFSYQYKKTTSTYLTGLFILLITAGFISFQALPTLQLVHFSAHNSDDPWRYFSPDILKPLQALTILIPDYFGNPVTRNQWLDFNPVEGILYFGTLPLFLTIYAFTFMKGKTVNFFKYISIFALLSTTYPIARIIYLSKIPVLWTSTPLRAVTIFFFATSILTGIGFDLFIKNIKQISFTKLNIKFITNKTIIFIISYYSIFGSIIIYTLYQYITTHNNNYKIALRNSIIPTIILLIFSIIILIKIILKKYLDIQILQLKLSNILNYIILGLVIFDLFLFFSKWTPFINIQYYYPKHQLISKLQELTQHTNSKYYGITEPEIDTKNQLYSAEALNPLNLKYYSALIESLNQEKPVLQGKRLKVNIDQNSKNAKKMFDILGIKYHVDGNKGEHISGIFPYWLYQETDNNYPPIYSYNKYTIFENIDAFNKIKVFDKYQIITDDKKTLEAIISDNWDYQNQIILNSNPKIQITENKLDAQITDIKLNNNQQIFKINTNKPVIAQINNSYYPEWHAFVNNKEVNIIRSNYAFMSIAINKGESYVEFKYIPSKFILGLKITLGTLIVYISWFIIFHSKK